MESPFMDAHTHHLPQKGKNIFACLDLSNGSFPHREEVKDHIFSLGIHPADTGKKSIQDLYKKMELFPDFAAIGECGLDKYIPADPEKQKELFLQQAFLAQELQKPLIIHCVKAWDILYQCAKKFPEKNRRWLIHSFRGDPALARDLLQHNFTLSFAPQMVKNMPERVKEMRETPFLLETDDSKEDIIFLYSQASRYCCMDIEELKEKNRQYFCNFFQISLE